MKVVFDTKLAGQLTHLREPPLGGFGGAWGIGDGLELDTAGRRGPDVSSVRSSSEWPGRERRELVDPIQATI